MQEVKIIDCGLIEGDLVENFDVIEDQVLKVVLVCGVKKKIKLRARVEKNARIDWFLHFGNCDLVELDLITELVGENAESNQNLLFFACSSQVMNLNAVNIFDAKNCKGQILAKGVVKDKAKVKFVGGITISLNGGGTDSYLKEEVIMLDDTSKIDAIPMLEIKTNDVKAGHGVSISRLSDDKIYYLTSRGIEPGEAKKLIVDGFLEDMLVRCGEKFVVDEFRNMY